MLFRTVYGLELEAIYQLIWNLNTAGIFPNKSSICSMVLHNVKNSGNQTQLNVEDALSFLQSARMITEREKIQACFDLGKKMFHLHLLENFVQIWKGMIPPVHPLDPLYIQLLNELFIEPDILFVANVHQEANRLKAVRDAGGISKEKVQAWKRVLEYLGVGFRVQAGFLCTYTPTLLQTIITDWAEDRGVLQDFLESHFSLYLPYCTKTGEIAKSAALSLKILEKESVIELIPLQDSPSHFYFGDQKLRGIVRRIQ